MTFSLNRISFCPFLLRTLVIGSVAHADSPGYPRSRFLTSLHLQRHFFLMSLHSDDARDLTWVYVLGATKEPLCASVTFSVKWG